MQFLGSDSRQTLRFRTTDRSAVDRPQEIIQKPLTRGSVIEHISDERGFRSFLHKIFQPHGSGVEALQKK